VNVDWPVVVLGMVLATVIAWILEWLSWREAETRWPALERGYVDAPRTVRRVPPEAVTAPAPVPRPVPAAAPPAPKRPARGPLQMSPTPSSGEERGSEPAPPPIEQRVEPEAAEPPPAEAIELPAEPAPAAREEAAPKRSWMRSVLGGGERELPERGRGVAPPSAEAASPPTPAAPREPAEPLPTEPPVEGEAVGAVEPDDVERFLSERPEVTRPHMAAERPERHGEQPAAEDALAAAAAERRSDAEAAIEESDAAEAPSAAVERRADEGVPASPPPAAEPPRRSFGFPPPRPVRPPPTRPRPPTPVEPPRAVPQGAAVMAFPPGRSMRREWNLWDLERLARSESHSSPDRAQEWSYLFLNLRQFAAPGGTLPPEFDPLIRESFGALLERIERT
jgi:hypothetical protein